MKKVISLLSIMVLFSVNFVAASSDDIRYIATDPSTSAEDTAANNEESGKETVTLTVGNFNPESDSTGEAHLRSVSRCENINEMFGSYLCNVHHITTGVRDTKSKPGAVYDATPNESSSIDLGIFSWSFYGINLTKLVEVALAGDLSVDHEVDSYDTNYKVTFNQPHKDDVDVPASIDYTELDQTYDGIGKGVGAVYRYSTTNLLEAYSNIEYDIRIDVGAMYPRIASVTTDDASVVFLSTD